jgi:hypothetical protein
MEEGSKEKFFIKKYKYMFVINIFVSIRTWSLSKLRRYIRERMKELAINEF